MLNHVSQHGWTLYNDALRPSVLGRPAGRRVYRLPKFFGGTIGQAVAHVLAQYRPLTRKQAEDFLQKGGQPEDWP